MYNSKERKSYQQERQRRLYPASSKANRESRLNVLRLISFHVGRLLCLSLAHVLEDPSRCPGYQHYRLDGGKDEHRHNLGIVLVHTEVLVAVRTQQIQGDGRERQYEYPGSQEGEISGGSQEYPEV